MQTFSVLLALCVGNSPAPGEFLLKGQWRGALMFSLICVWINGWVNNRENGDLRRYQSHYNVIAMTGLESDRFWMDPFLTNSHTLLYRDCVTINAKHKTLVFRDNQESQMLGRWCVGKICKLIHLSFLWFRWTFVGERYIIDRSLDGDFLKKKTIKRFSSISSLCDGNSPNSGGFPSWRASNAQLWCFLITVQIKLLYKQIQSSQWWFGTTWRPWAVIVMNIPTFGSFLCCGSAEPDVSEALGWILKDTFS